MRTGGLGLAVCWKRRYLFPFQFISLKTNTLFLKFKELNPDLGPVEASNVSGFLPRSKAHGRGEENRTEATPVGFGFSALLPSSLCFPLDEVLRKGSWSAMSETLLSYLTSFQFCRHHWLPYLPRH